jgi:hypothetical protein
MSAATRLKSESGYSLVELLISAAIMLTVTGAIFSMMNPSQGTAQVQPEVADLQQRMRVGSETLFKELVMVGAGTYQGAITGSLNFFFAPILPRRWGRIGSDAATVFRPDAITIMYIPNTYSQTTIRQPMPNPSAELKVDQQANCPLGQDLCGFTEGMEVIIFDTSGHFDVFEITQVQDDAAHLQHRGQDLSYPYDTGATITQAYAATYYLDRNTNQLKMYDGGKRDIALVDNVVDLEFSYFGDPNPPTQPKPQAGMANCLYDAVGNLLNTTVLPATDGSLAALDPAILTDGPFCGYGVNQFDSDLLRVRKVRTAIRMQVGPEGLRGTDTALWRNPGKSRGSDHAVPDYAVTFDVTPRNLNLAR